MDLKTVRKLLSNRSREDLLKIIIELSAYSEEAEEWLLDYCEQRGEASNAELVARKQVEHHWLVAENIIDEANCYGGPDEEGEDKVYLSLIEIGELSKKHMFGWDFRQSLIDRMLEQLRENNSGFEDLLIDACTELCREDGEFQYLAERLRGCHSRYYRKYAARLFLDHGDEDSFVEIQSRNLEDGSDYIVLADFFMRKGQQDRAVCLAESAVGEADSRLDEVYEWLFKIYSQSGQEEKLIRLYSIAQKGKCDIDNMTRLMVEYYADDYERMKPYLLKMPEVCRRKETKKWFDACRSGLTAEDLADASGRLYELLKTKAPADYLQLRIDEGFTDEVLRYLKEHFAVPDDYYSVDRGHILSRQLSFRYPEEVCTLYWRECESLCALTNKKYYPGAVSVLKEIKKICGKSHMEADWQAKYDAFTERHRRKKCLMELIGKEKSLN